MKIVIKRSADNQFYYVWLAKNGQVKMTSEMYKNKPTAVAKKDAKLIGATFIDETKK
jgi:uncharacterized protein YegP (UPF0339 family)